MSAKEVKFSDDARQRMLYLRNNLAKNEVHVAQYYMRRGAYIAAVNRAQYVIERFQRTSAVEDAETGLPLHRFDIALG